MTDVFDYVCGVRIVSRWVLGELRMGALAVMWEGVLGSQRKR